MKPKSLISIFYCTIFCCFLLVHAEEKTVILQQGINGYQGCTDTYLHNVPPDDEKSFAGSEELQIMYLSCWQAEQARTVVRFELTELVIPEGFKLIKAELSLRRFDQSGLAAAACHVVSEPWVADKITWNAKPVYDELNPVSDIESDESWITFTVTEAIVQLLNNPVENYGFLLSRSKNLDTKLLCHSSEYPEKSFRPKLSLTFSDANPIIHNSGTLPVSEQFRVRQNSGIVSLFLPWSGISNIAVYDTQGRKVFSLRSEASFTWIQLTQKLSSGKYVVTVRTPAIHITEKLFVVR